MVEVKAVLYFSSVHIFVETKTVNFFRNRPRRDSSEVNLTTIKDLSSHGHEWLDLES